MILRVALAAVFATAAVAKLRDRRGTRRAAREFGVAGRLAGVVAVGLPLFELTAALLLLPDRTVAWGAALSLVLLTAFTIAIGANLARGRRPDCNCFGQLHSAPVGWQTIARNLVLAAMAALVLAAGQPAGAYMAIALVLGAVGAMALDRRPDDWEAQGSNVRLAVGSAAPPFELQVHGGSKVSLKMLLSRGHPLLLVFSDPHCGACTALAPQLEHWQRAHVKEITIEVLEAPEVADTYGALGTPTAILVDVGGRIASAPAAGRPAIEALLAEHVLGFESRNVDAARDAAMEVAAARAAAEKSAGHIRRREALGVLGGAWAAVGAITQPALARQLRRRRPVDAECHPPCRDGQICTQFGDCVCPKGFDFCKGYGCVDRTLFYNSDKFCGGCPGTSANTPCPEGSECVAPREGLGGECRSGNSTCSPPCSGETVCCNGKCVNIKTDPDNCGGRIRGSACGHKCRPDEECCHGFGCFDTVSDPDRCATCAEAIQGIVRRCKRGQVCYQGRCRDKCPQGLRRCGDPSVGLATCGDPRTQSCCHGRLYDNDDLQFDDNHCGNCHRDCRDILTTASNPACCSGECVDLATNREHCGACGTVCPSNCECLPGPEGGGECTNCV